MLTPYEPSCRDSDYRCMDGNKDRMACAKILEFERNNDRD